ncbi:MAG: hypothetical protein KDD64_00925 [Bdellovibrionales bacterium]|nr:hypothetical protein [Bdellovibrionales bacterium]
MSRLQRVGIAFFLASLVFPSSQAFSLPEKDADVTCLVDALSIDGLRLSVEDAVAVCANGNGCESDSHPEEGYTCACGTDSGSNCSCDGDKCTCISGDGNGRMVCRTQSDGDCICVPSGDGDGVYCKAGLPAPGEDGSCFCSASGPNPACRRDGRFVTCRDDNKITRCRVRETTGKCECFTESLGHQAAE